MSLQLITNLVHLSKIFFSDYLFVHPLNKVSSSNMNTDGNDVFGKIFPNFPHASQVA